MTVNNRWLGTALLTVGLMVIVAAQKPLLDVRLGLWEMTSTTTMGGEMPGMDMSGMPPAQRAQMETAMKSMMGTHTNTSKSCVTKEDLETGDFATKDEDGNCKKTITKNTRTALEMNIVCTGDMPSTGQMTIAAASPTAFTAGMKSSTTSQGKTMNMNLAMTGKWLGADCGSVK